MKDEGQDTGVTGHRAFPRFRFSWRVFVVTLAAVAVLLAIGSGVARMANHVARDRAVSASVGEDGYTQRARARRETVLVIGASKDSTMGFSIIRADATRGTVYEVTLPPEMVLPQLDGPVKQLDDLYEIDPALVVMKLSDYLQIPIGHWVVVPPATYKAALTQENPALHFETLTQTSFLKDEFLAYRTSLESIPAEGKKIIPFATRPVECNGTLYVEPHREEVAEGIAEGWGLSVDELAAAPRVSVFNGTETRGLASDVAEKLVLRGFQVGEIGNAPDFSYDSCELEVRPGFEEDASVLMKTLGLGEIDIRPVSDKATWDIAVFIGKDYRPTSADN